VPDDIENNGNIEGVTVKVCVTTAGTEELDVMLVIAEEEGETVVVIKITDTAELRRMSEYDEDEDGILVIAELIDVVEGVGVEMIVEYINGVDDNTGWI